MNTYRCNTCGVRVIVDTEKNTRDIKATLKWNGIPKCELFKMATISEGTVNNCIIVKV